MPTLDKYSVASSAVNGAGGGGGSPIKSVQTVEVTIGVGNSFTHTLSTPVTDYTKTVCTYSVKTTRNRSVTRVLPLVYMSANDTINIYMRTTDSATMVFEIQLIEFDDIKSIQHAIINHTGARDYTINEVDMNKSIVFYHMGNDDTNGEDGLSNVALGQHGVWLTSPTNLRFEETVFSSYNKYFVWWVVEFN